MRLTVGSGFGENPGVTTLRLLSVVVSVTAGVFDIIAVIVVLAGAHDRRVARSFALMGCCMAVWTIALGFESIPGFTTVHASLLRFSSSSILLLPAIVFSNAVVWSGTRSPGIQRMKLVGWLIGLYLCLLCWRGLIFDGFRTYPWGSIMRPGPAHPVHVAFTLIRVCSGVVICRATLKRSRDSSERIRAKYWLFSVAVFFPLGLVNFLANYGVPVFPTSSIGNILMIAILAYAAVRHRLMDIDRFVMRTAATLLASVALVMPVAGAVIWARDLPVGGSSSLVFGCLLLAALVSLLGFSRLRSYIEQEVESSFFRNRRVARDAIRALSAELVKLPAQVDGGQHFTKTLMEGLGLDGIALYLQKKSGSFKLACSRGTITAPKLLERHAFATATIATPPEGAPVSAAVGWEICVPVRANEAELGYIVLGPKRSGAAIDDIDMALVTLVANQLAVALKNAEYVREIRRQRNEIDALRARFEAENVVLRSEVRSASHFGEIIGSSVALQRVLAVVEKVAPTDASVLITGETGTGKELIARAIHEASARRNRPLINVNCPAIPPELAESELFGHERGAFTGAVQARPGHFELAHGGTIFLDEIADLPMQIQVKLLRVLQEREVQRVGGRTVHKLDLRVLAATNHDLEAAMRAGRFREDLYFRLAAVRLMLPPLRERTDDIPMLASFFLERASRTHQRPIEGFTPEAMAALCRYSWPGNIRELQNVIERAVLLCTGDVIRPEYLSDLAPPTELALSTGAEKLRRIEQALAQTGGNHTAAARLLGISPSHLLRMMKSLGAKLPPQVH